MPVLTSLFLLLLLLVVESLFLFCILQSSGSDARRIMMDFLDNIMSDVNRQSQGGQ